MNKSNPEDVSKVPVGSRTNCILTDSIYMRKNFLGTDIE